MFVSVRRQVRGLLESASMIGARTGRWLDVFLTIAITLLLTATALFFGTASPHAQAALRGGLGSLKTVSVPPPSDIDRYVRDFRILTVLGKALF